MYLKHIYHITIVQYNIVGTPNSPKHVLKKKFKIASAPKDSPEDKVARPSCSTFPNRTSGRPCEASWPS